METRFQGLFAEIVETADRPDDRDSRRGAGRRKRRWPGPCPDRRDPDTDQIEDKSIEGRTRLPHMPSPLSGSRASIWFSLESGCGICLEAPSAIRYLLKSAAPAFRSPSGLLLGELVEQAHIRRFGAPCRGSINLRSLMPHPIVRFAPSPTGRIHIGNARTALLNFLYAKKHHGEFILRFDDTDVERSKEEYAQAIEVDLAWLGIVPDAVLRQSERFALYHAAAGKLRDAGTPLSVLRDRRGARPQTQAPAGARPAPRLRPGGARSIGCGAGQTRSRGPQAALALQTRPRNRALDRSRARREPYRLRLFVRSGAAARKRHLSLHLAVRRRRYRAENHRISSGARIM